MQPKYLNGVLIGLLCLAIVFASQFYLFNNFEEGCISSGNFYRGDSCSGIIKMISVIILTGLASFIFWFLYIFKDDILGKLNHSGEKNENTI